MLVRIARALASLTDEFNFAGRVLRKWPGLTFAAATLIFGTGAHAGCSRRSPMLTRAASSPSARATSPSLPLIA